jgi:hypothetical protein
MVASKTAAKPLHLTASPVIQKLGNILRLLEDLLGSDGKIRLDNYLILKELNQNFSRIPSVDSKITATIKMPKLSDEMTTRLLGIEDYPIISKWHKKVGDLVKNGDILAAVGSAQIYRELQEYEIKLKLSDSILPPLPPPYLDSDKSTVELENFDDGTLLEIFVEEGEEVPIGSPLAAVGEPGDQASSSLPSLGSFQEKKELLDASENRFVDEWEKAESEFRRNLKSFGIGKEDIAKLGWAKVDKFYKTCLQNSKKEINRLNILKKRSLDYNLTDKAFSQILDKKVLISIGASNDCQKEIEKVYNAAKVENSKLEEQRASEAKDKSKQKVRQTITNVLICICAIIGFFIVGNNNPDHFLGAGFCGAILGGMFGLPIALIVGNLFY